MSAAHLKHRDSPAGTGHKICVDVESLKQQDSDDHKEAERLTTENAKLSTQLTDVTESMGRVEERCAKLREYVTAVANDTYATEMFDCGGCRFFEQCYNDESKEHEGFGCQWRLWARELGIEVDDGETDHV